MMKVGSPAGRAAAVFSASSSWLLALQQQRRTLVALHGQATTLLTPAFRLRHRDVTVHTTASEQQQQQQRPPDPLALLSPMEQQAMIDRLLEWWSDKTQVLCLTGAGISTESGIPDYRGHEGSYYKGHQPMVHDQFMTKEYQRKRYWGRGLVGWKSFDEMQPNAGHLALAQLERDNHIGVAVDHCAEFVDESAVNIVVGGNSPPHTVVALVTQNVDTLHRRAGSERLVELHGRTDELLCMQCGSRRHRHSFHSELTALNAAWLHEALAAQTSKDEVRPDGDTNVQRENYEAIQVPPCTTCGGFMKPDVVFFGDTVPKSRVALCEAAVQGADGLLIVGSSLAVHSAFRHVRSASQRGIPIAILNVGPTRAEVEGINVLKLSAPAGPTLKGVVERLTRMRRRSEH